MMITIRAYFGGAPIYELVGLNRLMQEYCEMIDLCWAQL